MTTVLETPVTIGPVTQTVAEWIDERKLNLNTVLSRRRRGCSWIDALAKGKRPNPMKARINRDLAARKEAT